MSTDKQFEVREVTAIDRLGHDVSKWSNGDEALVVHVGTYSDPVFASPEGIVLTMFTPDDEDYEEWVLPVEFPTQLGARIFLEVLAPHLDRASTEEIKALGFERAAWCNLLQD